MSVDVMAEGEVHRPCRPHIIGNFPSPKKRSLRTKKQIHYCFTTHAKFQITIFSKLWKLKKKVVTFSKNGSFPPKNVTFPKIETFPTLETFPKKLFHEKKNNYHSVPKKNKKNIKKFQITFFQILETVSKQKNKNRSGHRKIVKPESSPPLRAGHQAPKKQGAGHYFEHFFRVGHRGTSKIVFLSITENIASQGFP